MAIDPPWKARRRPSGDPEFFSEMRSSFRHAVMLENRVDEENTAERSKGITGFISFRPGFDEYPRPAVFGSL
jgi:hypothetical protein